MNALKTFLKSLKRSFVKPQFLIGSIVLDMAFLFLVGFVMPFIRPFIDHHATSLHQIIAGSIQAAGAGTQAPSIMSLIFQDIAQPFLVGVIFWLLVSLVVIYLLYVVVSGTAWWLGQWRAGHKKKWKIFFPEFAWLNVRWFPILALLWILYTIIDVRFVAILSSTQVEPSRALHWIVGIISIYIFYVMIVSYSRLTHFKAEKAFKGSWKQALKKNVWITGLIIVVLFVLLQFLAVWLMLNNPTLGFYVGSALLFTLIFITRVSMTRAVWNGIRKQP
jgi:hypothetical protein